MRVLLINTPYPFSEHPTLPVGLMSIAACLEQASSQVEVLDLLLTHYLPLKIEEKLRLYKPQIIGITSVTMNFLQASQIIRFCKEIDPEVITIIGGPHVTFTVEQTLRENPWIDIVIRGEGEETMVELIGVLEKGDRDMLDSIPGLAFIKDNQIVITPPRPFLTDVNSLPRPASHLFPLARYRALQAGFSILTGRGCPFNCIFCVGHKMVGKTGRYRDPVLVVDEIEDACNYGFGLICIEDDLFTLNHRHVYAICDEILKRKLTVSWSVFARVDTINKPLLVKMKEAGCENILFGVESGNQEILDIIKKKTSLDKIRRAVDLCKAVGIDVFASFIIGLPGETRQTLKATAEFARELGSYYGFHVLTPFPGTEIRDKAAEYGLNILSYNWEDYNADIPITETPGAKPGDIEQHLADYFAAIEIYSKYQEEAMQKGSLDPKEVRQVENRQTRSVVWELLSRDLVEELGQIKLPGGLPDDEWSQKELIKRLVPSMPLSEEIIKKELDRLINQGILLQEIKDGEGRWRWSNNNELKGNSIKAPILSSVQ